ncbi:uncharacterized protein [Coffea arabica]|uniref:Uncharacterized protein n=1 Tax=Coffea arabica TaxID=13443 RepID=A0ABM4UEM6_COFAR
MDYPTDACPILQEDGAEKVNMARGVPVPHRQYDPYSNTYNPDSGDSLIDIVKSLAISTTQFQKKTRSGMKDMETRISHMATTINRLESHVFEKLSSQPKTNPKNVSVMTLRSGKEVEGPKLKKTKKAEKEKEILDIFQKVEINIPLLDALKQVSKYAKFLKDLCIYKRKKWWWEKMCRLYFKGNSLRSLEIQVNELVFPTDFCVLNMGDERSLNLSPILLDRLFLSIVRTKIDVNEGTLSMGFDGEMETFEFDEEDALGVALAKHLELGATLSVGISDELYHAVEALHSLPSISSRYELTSVFVPETQRKLSPSVVQAPELELKPFPKHLKYVFLGDKETLPVIISAHLSPS